MGTHSFTYDANGNMITGLYGKTMAYDGENRPVSVNHQGDTTSYSYGPDGKRLIKDVTSSGQTLYAGAIEVRDYGTANEIAVFHPHEDIRIVDGVTSYQHRDHLASVRMITDATSDPDLSKSYTPFGLESITQLDATTHIEAEGFIGERYDPETGLQYLNARYYDPTLGLFVQPDWFEVTKAGVGTNRYAYSFNDPINLYDPNGNVAITVPTLVTLFILSMAGAELSSDAADGKVDGNGFLSSSVNSAAGAFGDFISAISKGDGKSDPRKAFDPKTRQETSITHAAAGGPGCEPDDCREYDEPIYYTHSQAFRVAKEKGGVPRSMRPTDVRSEQLTDQPGRVMSRVWEYRLENGRVVTIKEHSLGHPQGPSQAHFNTIVRDARGIKVTLRRDQHTYFYPRQ